MVLGTNGSLVGQITKVSLEKRLGALRLTKTNKYLGILTGYLLSGLRNKRFAYMCLFLQQRERGKDQT